MGETSIQWTDRTWNPVTGCTKVSPGCKNCYAEKVADRFWKDRKFTDVRCHEYRLTQPLHWRKPQKVFVNSMSDLFHEDVPMGFVMQVFAVMLLTPKHSYQILTKRPERMLQMLTAKGAMGWVHDCAHQLGREIEETWSKSELLSAYAKPDSEWNAVYENWPLRNVWLGVSVEDQKHADERIPILLQTPAAVRFVSYEPALGPVDFTEIIGPGLIGRDALLIDRRFSIRGEQHLDWVIVGGESGPGARPFDMAWARQTIQQCQQAGVPCFFKQAGSVPMVASGQWKRGDGPFMGHLLSYTNRDKVPEGFEPLKFQDRKGGSIEEWPEWFRVREFPA